MKTRVAYLKTLNLIPRLYVQITNNGYQFWKLSQTSNSELALKIFRHIHAANQIM